MKWISDGLAGESVLCRSVVITTGTFLRGIIHIGSQSRPAGRMPSTTAAHAAAGARCADAKATDAADETAAKAAGSFAVSSATLPAHSIRSSCPSYQLSIVTWIAAMGRQ